MANLNYLWTDTSSIEEMLKQFELRDNIGKLKYSRLLLKPIRSFGSSYPLTITLIIKRTSYSCEGFLTFSDLKNHLAYTNGFFHSTEFPFGLINSFINDYETYLHKNMFHNPIQGKTYLFDQFITLGGRSKKYKLGSKYGVCKMYELYGIKISPAKRGWKTWHLQKYK